MIDPSPVFFALDPVLLASAADDLRRVAEVMRDGGELHLSPSGFALILGGAGAMLTSAVAYSLLSRDRSRHGAAFREICRAFSLERRHRRALLAAAETLDDPSPAALLVSRGCFETALRRLRPDREMRALLDDVGARVFGR